MCSRRTKLCVDAEHPPGVREDCMPGCWVGTPNWCSGDPQAIWDCAWPPQLTKEMLELHIERLASGGRRLGAAYNEIILSRDSMIRNLPDAIEAFIFTDRSQEALASHAHQRFLQEYPEATTPLLFK